MLINSAYRQSTPQCRERGAVLLVALIFLVVLSLLGINSLDSTMLETKLATNNQEKNWSFQVAESGLRQAEAILEDTDGKLTDVITNGSAPVGTDGKIQYKRADGAVGGDVFSAYAVNLSTEYKGRFSPVRQTDAKNAFGKSQVEMVYFETASTGQNWTKEDGSPEEGHPPMEVALRGGYRQSAPKLPVPSE